MPHKIDISDNAIFISDAHYNKHRRDFYYFLKDIDKDKILCSQLIICGDMFDLLIGNIRYTISYNLDVLMLLNKISEKLEIIYLEGNHDFVLSNIMPKIKVFPISKQPIIANYKNSKILISHGDKFTNDIFYRYIYVVLSRNYFILKILNFFDNIFNNIISKSIISNQIIKNKCYKIENFNNRVQQRENLFNSYKADIVIEGHHHQDKIIKRRDFVYINLPAFACTKKYVTIKELYKKIY
jgi:UDP-2,3-diacylglucosamine hydrolase